ncbi:hypothetical protein AB0L65_32775 [Nonomuraea sp. NPDC052116]|uniref:hypothetical protein n=1 Tax=Nonomuraea sp. NPDC052116 TaxID=3155665 RepID=UPI0034365674
MRLELYCQGCDVTGPHEVDGKDAVCLACGTIREVDSELLAGVLEMAFCDTCRETRPVGHSCYPDATSCLSRTQLQRCGVCEPCVALQSTDPRYGSPSDLYPS